MPTKCQLLPHKYREIKYGAKEQYTHIDDSSDVKERLIPYKHAAQSECRIITSKTKGTNAKCRVVRSKKNRGVKYIVLGQNKNAMKSSERKDKLTARKWKEQNKCVEVFVQSRWNDGDPCTQSEVYDMLRMRDVCAEGTEFYLKKLASGKQSGLAKFLSDALDRFHFSVRKNSIGQTVPENWRELAEKNSADLNKLFLEGKVDVVINADQTFVNFLPEAQYVLAPKGAKRIGGKIKGDEKSGFTLMVAAELNSSQLLPPFVVFNGTRIEESKRPQTTNHYKYKEHHNRPGRTAHVTFQKKHWFDDCVTLEWLEMLVSLYPNKRIGFSWDQAPAHQGPISAKFIADHDNLVVGDIYGSITSVSQVCDIICNKPVKGNIRNLYYRWRTYELKIEREKAGGELSRSKFRMTI